MEDVDVIKRIVESGEVRMGTRSVSKELAEGKPKLVILSSNCPTKLRNELVDKASDKVPMYTYKGTSIDLGEACRKPFPISAMAVVDAGDANITQLVKEAKA